MSSVQRLYFLLTCTAKKRINSWVYFQFINCIMEAFTIRNLKNTHFLYSRIYTSNFLHFEYAWFVLHLLELPVLSQWLLFLLLRLRSSLSHTRSRYENEKKRNRRFFLCFFSLLLLRLLLLLILLLQLLRLFVSSSYDITYLWSLFFATSASLQPAYGYGIGRMVLQAM